MKKTIRQKSGIEKSSRKRGFVDFTVEMFYIDFVEPGNSRKAPFVVRTQAQMEMLQRSDCKSLSVRAMQRIMAFEKRSVNIVLQKSQDHFYDVLGFLH